LLSDVAVRVETTDGTVALSEDLVAFFDERFDVVDEFLFIKFLAGCSVRFLDVLGMC